jgi:hypothetical protein
MHADHVPALAVPSFVGFRAVDNVLGLEHNLLAHTRDTLEPVLPGIGPLTYPPQMNISNPGNGDSSLAIESYEGTYIHSAYGTFTLCSPSSTSHYCSSVLDTFKTVYHTLSPYDLLADWPRFWTRHLYLRYVDANRYNVETTTVFPSGYGRDTTPFQQREPHERFEGEFVTEGGTVKGFAMRNGFQSGFEEKIKVADPRRTAQVYFEKV